MSQLKRTIARKQAQIRQEKQRLHRARGEIAQSVKEGIRSPIFIAGGFAAGFGLALLRCRGSASTQEEDGAAEHRSGSALSALEWIIKHLGPPIILALMQQRASEDEDLDDDPF